MSTPPITLWGKKLTVPLRLADCPLPIKGSRQSLDNQKDQVHKNAWELELSGGALYIMSEIVGRRIPESVRWILQNSLREVLDGSLQNYHAEREALLTGTFGELLGPLLLGCYLSRTRLEAIRLLETPQIKTPDFLILEQAQNGPRIHLLECKATTDDFYKIQTRAQTNVCSDIRRLAHDGKTQLGAFEFGDARLGGSVSMGGSVNGHFAVRQYASSENVSALHVTDGRIPLQLPSDSIEPPDKTHCGDVTITCIDCMRSPQVSSPSLAGCCIAVLHRGPRKHITPPSELLQFVRGYQQTNLGLWARNDEFFAQGIRQQLGSIQASEGELRDTLATMTAATILVASGSGLSFVALGDSLPILLQSMPQEFQAILPSLGRLIEISPDIPETIQAEEFVGSARDRAFEPGTRTLMQGVLPESNTNYSATVQALDDTTTIRIVSDAPFDDVEESIQRLLQRWIEGLRGVDTRVDWKEEYAELRQVEPEKRIAGRVRLGTTWDPLPYPLAESETRRGRPGISAWIATSGQAELIVRRRAFYP